MPNLSSAGFQASYDPRDQPFDDALFPDRSTGQGTRVTLHHPTPTRTQGAVDCCVAHTLVCCMEILDAEVQPFEELSVLFLYFAARRVAGHRPNQLESLTFQQGFRAIQQFGVCGRALHPRRITRALATRAPSPAAISDARQHRLSRHPVLHWSYQRIATNNRVRAMKTILLARRPVALAFWITDAYSALTRQTTHPPPNRRTDLAHAVPVIGFNDRKLDATGQHLGAFLVKDSRGPTFGRNGHWWLPYRLANSNLVFEAWTLAGVNY